MEDVLQALRAVAEPTRLRIVALCAHAELSVTEFVQILGQSQPRVSRHLKLLVEAGVMQRNREGVRAFYRLAERGPGRDLAGTIADLLPDEDETLAIDLARLDEIRTERARRAEAYFRDNAERWEELRGLYVDDSEVDAELRRVVAAGTARSLLDIGTGTGRVLRTVGDVVDAAVGIDNSTAMLEVARTELDAQGLKNCQVRLADMYRLPFPAGRFDVVTANMLMHHADHPARMIEEAARVLRPGGRLVVVDFAPHEMIELRDEHEHRWLGFSNPEMERFFDRAGLAPLAPERLDGEHLTVCIWVARKAIEVANDSPSKVEIAS